MYCSKDKLHSFQEEISLSLVLWSKTWGFGSSFHHDLDSSPVWRLSIAWAACAAAAADSAA